MTDEWGDEGADEQALRVVQGIVRLARSDEACRILGVDGTLEEDVDVSFLADPLSWIATEIATGLQAAEEDEDEDTTTTTGAAAEVEGVALSRVVALVRLYELLHGTIDEQELADAVLDYEGD